ncbi:hypothetical protein SAMN04487967_3270 [Natronorubrum sediminis]|uniref:Uncharacterized protein n=1 Tax=Natronorubrum sediminis TaxID=640943 RepID=A0A1H6G6R6_9EURY|nr:hypothetical protein SAMN04487967_3270 [Natronorubrum sediminis]
MGCVSPASASLTRRLLFDREHAVIDGDVAGFGWQFELELLVVGHDERDGVDNVDRDVLTGVAEVDGDDASVVVLLGANDYTVSIDFAEGLGDFHVCTMAPSTGKDYAGNVQPKR